MDDFSTQFISTERKPWFKRPLFYVGLIIVVFLGYFVIRLGNIYNAIVVTNGQTGPNVSPTIAPEPDRLDVLILGIRGYSQQEIEQEGGLLTDTIQVISIDKKNKKVAVISVPRDLYIDIDGTKRKINEMYAIGLEHNRGLAFSEETISRLTGIHIDNAIVFDFKAFQNIVDTLGGVDIKLAKPFSEPLEWGYPFSLPAGLNHLNGEQALYYARSRYSSNDFDRSRRQQEIISAIHSEANKQGYLSNPLKITNLLNNLKDDVRTDFQLWDIKNLMTLASSFGTKTAIINYIISTENLLYESHSAKGEYILLPKGDNFDRIKKMFLDIFAPSI